MTRILRCTLPALLSAALLPAQAIVPSHGVDFAGNHVAVLGDWNGGPALLIHNVAPQRTQELLRVLRTDLPLRLRVDLLAFTAGSGRVVLRAGSGASLWQRELSPTGLTLDSAPGVTLQTANGAASASLGFETGGGATPAFLAVVRAEPVPFEPEVQQFTGFETGDFGELFDAVGSVALQSAVVNSGRFALRSTTNAGDYGYVTLSTQDPDGLVRANLAVHEVFLSFWFRFASSEQWVRVAEVGGTTSSVTKARIELGPDFRFNVEDSAHVRRWGTTQLAPDTWYRIRLRVATGPAARITLLVNDTVEIDAADADCGADVTRRVHIGRASRAGGPADYYFDDVVVSSGDFVPDARVMLLRPVAPGHYVDWTGQPGAASDWPHDGDASYNESTGLNTSMTHALEDVSTSGTVASVLAVKAMAVARRTEATLFTPSRLRLRSGSADFDAASGDGGVTFRLRAKLFAADPATAAPWTLDAIDALEVGMIQEQAIPTRFTRMTAAGATILYRPTP
jgi:hypothetical protein